MNTSLIDRQSPRRSPDGFVVEDHEWRKLPAALKDDWRALTRRGGFDYSLSPDWLEVAATSFGLAEQIRILVARVRGEACGVLPYLVHRKTIWGIPATAIELAGNKLVCYHQEIVSPECQAAMLRALLQGREWHVFVAEAVPSDGPTARAIRDHSKEFGQVLHSLSGERSPYLPIATDWETFCNSKPKRFRYERRKHEKYLREAGALQVRWFTAPSDVAALYDAMLTIESKSWKSAAGIAVSQRQREQTYYQNLLPHLASCGALLANALVLSEKPVAYSLCCSWNGRITQLKATFDDDFRELAPGALAMHLAVRKAFEVGATEFDFLGDAMPHKLEWTNQIRAHENYHVFSKHWRSRLLGRLKNRVHQWRQRRRE